MLGLKAPSPGIYFLLCGDYVCPHLCIVYKHVSICAHGGLRLHFPRDGVTDGYEAPDMGSETQTLEEQQGQQVLLATEPWLQSHRFFLLSIPASQLMGR